MSLCSCRCPVDVSHLSVSLCLPAYGNIRTLSHATSLHYSIRTLSHETLPFFLQDYITNAQGRTYGGPAPAARPRGVDEVSHPTCCNDI